MAKSLNKVQLIGNLTRDPEMRYTPQGTAVCTFGIATNRQWTTEAGDKKNEADFHSIVAWNKLAEICAQHLKKGRKVYVEGRLQTRNWQAQDGAQKSRTEVVISDMIILDRKDEIPGTTEGALADETSVNDMALAEEAPGIQVGGEPNEIAKKEGNNEEAEEEDIPF